MPLGGADEIGASCFYLNISGTGILLDCGIHPRNKGIAGLPKFELLDNEPVDFVFISHAHQDHIGSLPFLIQRIPHVIIYSTPQTKEIAELTLHNAANILYAGQNSSDELKIYTHEEIDLLVRSIRTAAYSETIILKGLRHYSTNPINITFYDAGHILGAAGIKIEFENEIIFYTGDINLSGQSIMTNADLSQVKNTGTLILESTYGATESSKLGTLETEQKRFALFANQIIHNGGSVLIPVFALGKTQEILALIHLLMKKKILTEAAIYTGGIGREISTLYDKNRYLIRRNHIKLELKEIPQINLHEIEDYNFFKNNPGIVLASSGMMIEGTASFKLMNYWLAMESFGIFGVGYMDKETPGFKVLSAKQGDKIKLTEFGTPYKVKCKIERFYFPSHSKREDLLAIVRQTNAERVILIHGDHEAKDWLGYNILNKFKRVRVHSAETGKQIILTTV
jgi:Cft2 family RNA processing exonuclease